GLALRHANARLNIVEDPVEIIFGVAHDSPQSAPAAVDIFAHAVGEREARRVVHGVAGHRRPNLMIDVANEDQFVDALAYVDAEAVVPVGRGFIGDVG